MLKTTKSEKLLEEKHTPRRRNGAKWRKHTYMDIASEILRVEIDPELTFAKHVNTAVQKIDMPETSLDHLLKGNVN